MQLAVTVPWGERLGGAETMLETLLRASMDTEHQIEVIFLGDGPWPSEIRGIGFHATVINAGRLRDLKRRRRAVRLLAQHFEDRVPDLVVNWSAKTQLYGGPASRQAGLGDRTVWWQHGIPLEPDWITRVATLLPTQAIGCCSNAARDAQNTIRPRRTSFVVPCGISEPKSTPAHLDLPDVPIVGLVGRLQPWKGQRRLLEAQAILREREISMHSLIVGGDAYGLAPEYAKSLPKEIDRLGLSGLVTMTGQVPDAGPYIERMDILINASESEPFGIVLLEAMARRVPVIAVDAGGPADLIESGLTGLLAKSGSPHDLADALEPLILSRSLRLRLGERGHERYQSDFTADAMCRRFFSCLEKVKHARKP